MNKNKHNKFKELMLIVQKKLEKRCEKTQIETSSCSIITIHFFTIQMMQFSRRIIHCLTLNSIFLQF